MAHHNEHASPANNDVDNLQLRSSSVVATHAVEMGCTFGSLWNVNAWNCGDMDLKSLRSSA